MTFFLDTDTCIYYLTGKFPILLTKIMSKKPNDIKIPAIVKAELNYGFENWTI